MCSINFDETKSFSDLKQLACIYSPTLERYKMRLRIFQGVLIIDLIPEIGLIYVRFF